MGATADSIWRLKEEDNLSTNFLFGVMCVQEHRSPEKSQLSSVL